MLPRKFHFYAFSFVMSLFMSGVVSLAMLSVDHPNVFEAFTMWPKAWVVSMLVAFPVSLFVVPVTQRLVSKIVTDK